MSSNITFELNKNQIEITEYPNTDFIKVSITDKDPEELDMYLYDLFYRLPTENLKELREDLDAVILYKIKKELEEKQNQFIELKNKEINKNIYK